MTGREGEVGRSTPKQGKEREHCQRGVEVEHTEEDRSRELSNYVDQTL